MTKRRTRDGALAQPASKYLPRLRVQETTGLPTVLYVAQADDLLTHALFFDAQAGFQSFDDGDVVGVYDLREVRKARVTRTLVPR